MAYLHLHLGEYYDVESELIIARLYSAVLSSTVEYGYLLAGRYFRRALKLDPQSYQVMWTADLLDQIRSIVLSIGGGVF